MGLTLPALADTFTLKDGTTLEGSILRETDTSYVLEIKSPRASRTNGLSKDDVVKIEREKPDLTAFEAIKIWFPHLT